MKPKLNDKYCMFQRRYAPRYVQICCRSFVDYDTSEMWSSIPEYNRYCNSGYNYIMVEDGQIILSIPSNKFEIFLRAQ